MQRIQVISIVFSLLMLLFILNLIRRKRINVEYSLIWLTVSIVFVVFSFWRQGVEELAELLGLAYAPSVLFILLIFGIFLILVEFSIIISKQSERIRILAQEHALLKKEVEKIKLLKHDK